MTEKDADAVKRIVSRFIPELGNFKMSLLGGSSNNDNYLVEDGENKIVVKLSKAHREDKALREYVKEKWCMDKARILDIPVPTVLGVDEWEGRAFMLQSYIEGKIPADNEASKVWAVLGKYAKRIHSVVVSGWGENLTDESGNFDESWERHLQYDINALTDNDPLLQMGVLTKSLSREIKSLFQSLNHKQFRFGLCHGDIALWNTLIDAGGTVYLLDWGCARAEVVPHYEINEILRTSKPDAPMLKAFLEGYGISEEEYKSMKDDLETLTLLREIDTLRWAIDKKPDEAANLILKVDEALGRKYGTAKLDQTI